MILNRRLGAFAALLAASVWAIGCAEETVEDPVGNGAEVGAPANGVDAEAGTDLDGDAGAPDATGDDLGLEGGSTTGAGVDLPDPLDEPEATPVEPEPENE